MIALTRFQVTRELPYLVVMVKVFAGLMIAAPTDALAQTVPAQFATSVISSPSHAIAGGDALVQVGVTRVDYFYRPTTSNTFQPFNTDKLAIKIVSFRKGMRWSAGFSM